MVISLSNWLFVIRIVLCSFFNQWCITIIFRNSNIQRPSHIWKWNLITIHRESREWHNISISIRITNVVESHSDWKVCFGFSNDIIGIEWVNRTLIYRSIEVIGVFIIVLWNIGRIIIESPFHSGNIKQYSLLFRSSFHSTLY